MSYELMREIAGSWMLLFMFLFFCAVILWVLRPGSARTYRDTANMIFRNEDGPGPDQASDAEQGPEEGRA